MQNHFSGRLVATLGLLMTFLAFVPRVRAQGPLTPLWIFGIVPSDGGTVYSAPIFDPAGNIYGTASEGGTHGLGMVFKLTPTTSGLWKETILYNFKGGLADGSTPHATLFRDAAGNLYGTTFAGGLTSSKCGQLTPLPGCGIVFKLTPTAQGQWTETILHKFTGPEGGNSLTSLVPDKAGNFYGATAGGGSKGLGVIFKMSKTTTGTWVVTVLHNFTGNPDGANPFIHCMPLVFDSAGNIYGTTEGGGAAGNGIVFKLIPPRTVGAAWSEKILHTFQDNGIDGRRPMPEVILDKQGNVFGTTISGGTHNQGTAYELVAANNYAESILYDFKGPIANDGSSPNGLIFDATGNLFGTSQTGGVGNNGTIFKLTRTSSGWEETVLHSFSPAEGTNPFVPMIFGADGHLYGSGWIGGSGNSSSTAGGGSTFEFVP
ncbi:MAG TPA: choice-of-anchor tandem repeat GloVer-containing protein [Candidatus Sulfotelmatobacter sp.]|nr:choice-of-anchor tandem repeat GloVer-containing protein [Candidatus Sulfotelmatobacter sp.]